MSRGHSQKRPVDFLKLGTRLTFIMFVTSSPQGFLLGTLYLTSVGLNGRWQGTLVESMASPWGCMWAWRSTGRADNLSFFSVIGISCLGLGWTLNTGNALWGLGAASQEIFQSIRKNSTQSLSYQVWMGQERKQKSRRKLVGPRVLGSSCLGKPEWGVRKVGSRQIQNRELLVWFPGGSSRPLCAPRVWGYSSRKDRRSVFCGQCDYETVLCLPLLFCSEHNQG